MLIQCPGGADVVSSIIVGKRHGLELDCLRVDLLIPGCYRAGFRYFCQVRKGVVAAALFGESDRNRVIRSVHRPCDRAGAGLCYCKLPIRHRSKVGMVEAMNRNGSDDFSVNPELRSILAA